MRLWLKALAVAKGIKLTELSKDCGVTYQMMNKYINGKSAPKIPVAKQIAARLGFDWRRFYE